MLDANTTLRIFAYTEVQEERDIAARAFFPGNLLSKSANPSEKGGITFNPLLPRGVLPQPDAIEPKPISARRLEARRKQGRGSMTNRLERSVVDSVLSHGTAHSMSHPNEEEAPVRREQTLTASAFEEPTWQWARPVYETTMIRPATDSGLAEVENVEVQIEDPLSEVEWSARMHTVTLPPPPPPRSRRRWPWVLAFAFSSALGAATVFSLAHFGVLV